jgi:hypothetical protein
MILTIVLVVIAVLSLSIIFRLAVTQKLQTRGNAQIAGGIRPIDIEAFHNLINPAEDDYLRRRLSGPQFRRVRRLRLRAMAAYVEVAAGNAAFLVGVGEAAIASGDPQVASAAHHLVNDALLLRRNTTVVLARIYLALAWPNSGFAAGRVAERYERLSGAAMLLGRLQNPAVPIRLSSTH